ncbi:putative exonuclease mut-7-like protein [Operophtera brumata]|uniref:Putative exonuclease mut-7-like protein n=1 Tax=Operophtera brumata TaxID=104452 RepID=A0A0L7KQT0_OPEBR|nr:putative exonuclease mut-7-like protein [Operophtera brumata]
MEESKMDSIISKCQSIKIIPSLEDTLRSMGLNIELDTNTQAWLEQVRIIWKTWKRSTAMEGSIEDLFRSRPDAFRVALVFVIKCEEYKDCKPKSLPYFIMEILMKYSRAHNIHAEDSLKMPAFHIAVYQRNQHFLNLMVKAYQIVTIKESIIPMVKDMIKNENSKQASQVVIAMELFDDIPVEDLLFPLVLLDKPNMIDDYLSEAPSQITAFLLFLDKLLDRNFKMLDFVQDYAEKNNIGHVKYDKLHRKPLGKLVARLCNKYNIPVETCKNLSNNRTASGLRYLVYRKYTEHNITTSVWEDLVKDSLRQNSDSIHSFLDLLIDHDRTEALKWAKYFNVPETQLPLALRGDFDAIVLEDNWDTESEVTHQHFYKSPLTREQITIIETSEQFYDLISTLTHLDIVSLDCEWKPSFGTKQCQVAIIQLGTKDMVYLIDAILLNKPEYTSFWCSFNKSFLENAEIIKLGFGLEQDLREMKASIAGLSNIKQQGIDFEAICNCIIDEGTKKTVKKPKAVCSQPHLPVFEAKSPAYMKILVDMKLNNIISYLRYCGIDTISRSDSMLWHDVINLATSEDRLIIVSKPKNTPNNNFPQSSILCIGKGPITEQLHKIINTYNVSIQQSDLMTVCLFCNSKDLRKLNCDQVQELCKAYEAVSKEQLNTSNIRHEADDDVDFGDFLSDSEGDEDPPQYQPRNTVTKNQSCKTSKGVQIVVDDASKLCVSKKPAVLCEDCGSLCSDEDTVLKTISEIVLKVTKLAQPT